MNFLKLECIFNQTSSLFPLNNIEGIFLKKPTPVLLGFNCVWKKDFLLFIICIFRSMNIVNEYFHVNHFFTVLHQTHCNNLRVTEILVVLSGDFCRYLTFSLLSWHKRLNFFKWEIIILWIYCICYVYGILRNTS